jgi:hypothetical protein
MDSQVGLKGPGVIGKSNRISVKDSASPNGTDPWERGSGTGGIGGKEKHMDMDKLG